MLATASRRPPPSTSSRLPPPADGREYVGCLVGGTAELFEETRIRAKKYGIRLERHYEKRTEQLHIGHSAPTGFEVMIVLVSLIREASSSKIRQIAKRAGIIVVSTPRAGRSGALYTALDAAGFQRIDDSPDEDESPAEPVQEKKREFVGNVCPHRRPYEECPICLEGKGEIPVDDELSDFEAGAYERMQEEEEREGRLNPLLVSKRLTLAERVMEVIVQHERVNIADIIAAVDPNNISSVRVAVHRLLDKELIVRVEPGVYAGAPPKAMAAADVQVPEVEDVPNTEVPEAPIQEEVEVAKPTAVPPAPPLDEIQIPVPSLEDAAEVFASVMRHHGVPEINVRIVTDDRGDEFVELVQRRRLRR